MSLPATRSEQRYTWADYLSWPDSERWELLEGIAYAKEGGTQTLSAAPSRLHQAVQGALFFQIYAFLRNQPCKVYTAPIDVRLTAPSTEGDTVVQPDILVICDAQKLTAQGCLGSPDWIIEIVSPGSAAMDYVKKLNLYEKHGVREYWVVHPFDETIMVFRLGQNGRYERPETYGADACVIAGLFVGRLVIDFASVYTEARAGESQS